MRWLFSFPDFKQRVWAVCALLFALYPMAPVHAQTVVVPTLGTLPPATSTTINNGAGNQFDPHVDGNLVSYTSSVSGDTSIRYFDFSTSSDQAISNLLADGSRAMDILSDVSGDIIVFTRIVFGRSSIYSFDTSTAGPAIELDPQSVSTRVAAAIGGGTVAWMDNGLAGTSGSSEIVAYDLAAAIATRLTNDAQFDRIPAVSADGLVIAWEKCPTPGSGCDIFHVVRSGGGWTVTQLTSTSESESAPDTNGLIVVYAATRTSSTTGADVYWTPVAGGSEVQLSLAGEERNPNVSRNVVAFEHVASGELNADVFAYDLDGNTLYQITSTPNYNETLNDIWVSAAGEVRIVWSVVETDQNVYGLTFLLNRPPVACAPDQTVAVGSVVTLDASCSADPDGHYPLSYAWDQTSIPEGSTMELSDYTSVTPTFTADLPGDYVIYLAVTDSTGRRSEPIYVTVHAVFPDTDGDGLPDVWETFYGLDPNDPTDAGGDLDGDGFNNLQEYIGQTDPTRVPGISTHFPPPGTPNFVRTLDDQGRAIYLVAPPGVVISAFQWIDPATLPSGPRSLPFGLVAINLQVAQPGDTVTVAVTFPGPVATGSSYYKYGATAGDPSNHWYPFPYGSDNGDATITLTLTDGGAGDHDLPANGVIVDPGGPGPLTLPTITAVVDPLPNLQGWNGADVTVRFTCSDILGVASCPDPVMVSTEGAGQVITGTAVNVAGASASTSVTINLDKTPPVLTCPLDTSLLAVDLVGAPGTHAGVQSFVTGATATDLLDAAVVLTHHAPGFFPIGTTTVTFTAMDAAENATSCLAVLTVVDPPPVFSPPGDQIVDEGQTLTLVLSATDPNDPSGERLAYSATGLPTGATFEATTRTLSYAPDYTVSTRLADRAFDVMASVTDGTSTVSMPVHVVVRNVNRAPVASAGLDQQLACAGSACPIILDGSGSTDPDSSPGTQDDLADYRWYEAYGTAEQQLLGIGSPLVVILDLGVHTVTLEVTDQSGATGIDTVTIALDPARLSLFVLEKAEVDWPKTTEAVADVKIHGRMALPVGLLLPEVSPAARVRVDLAGQTELFMQTVAFEAKGAEREKWEYKANPPGAGIQRFFIHWKGTKFDYAGAVRLKTESIALDQTTLALDRGASTDPVSVSVGGVTVTVDGSGAVVTSVPYEIDEDGEITFALPFELTPEMAITLTVGALPPQMVRVGDYYTPGSGKFEFNAKVNVEALTGASRPAILEMGVALGNEGFPGSAGVSESEWKMLSTREWKAELKR